MTSAKFIEAAQRAAKDRNVSEFCGLASHIHQEIFDVDLPAPKMQDPNAAAALQELLRGKYGEMSTLGNYIFQSFNFRSKE